MKKFYKKSLLSLFSLVSLGLTSLGPLTVVKSHAKTTNVAQMESEKKVFNEDQHNLFLLDQFLNSAQAKEEYLFQQNNINFTQLWNLKYSLVWYNPILSWSRHNDNLSFTRFETGKSIFENLTINWWWYLFNINHLNFSFNPYGSGFANYPEEKNDFLDLKKFFASTSFRLSTNKIQQIYKVDLITLREDLYKTKSVFYLQYQNNYFVKIYRLVDSSGVIRFIVWPDLYYLNNPEDPQTFWKEFEQKVQQLRMKKINNYISETDIDEELADEYQMSQLINIKLQSSQFTKNLFQIYRQQNIQQVPVPNTSTTDITQDPDYQQKRLQKQQEVETRAYRRFNDNGLYDEALEGSFYDYFADAVRQVNNEKKNHVLRYTLRSVYEN
ncbi:aromatic cluster surface protein [Mycoplasmoides fastidiosum]|uniref:Aromatic cluster surface protein n=1 Tax=Mycoplasmoides fastidiosum TaxID=92758 RepID=A0ABU0LZ03_9BACT|nr:aromatic motif membrane protein [Mycoplasmoides fastidiosum]MDQ0513938.1 aromatic cluster surface protein [Mycoplasmoides fastidiosum]UUD37648.1 hypothetical protein NPA10_03715 [Mycoplasmoides fastidiosum]